MVDPATATAAISAATVYICKTAYELVMRSKGREREICRADQATVKVELSSSALQASMNTQTRLLEEIKQGQQDTRDGVRELITLRRQQDWGSR